MDASEAPAPAEIGTEAGFRAFYDANVSTVYGYLLRLCGGDTAQAEDLTQTTWCELVDELAAGNVERARVGWLLTVARSRYLDHWRRDHRLTRPVRIAWATDEPMDPWEPQRTDVLDHLAGLDADHRMALMLRYVDELSVAEIADVIHRSLAATHSLLARARRELRARLEGAGDA